MTRMTRAEKSYYGYNRAVSMPKEGEEEDFMDKAHKKQELKRGE